MVVDVVERLINFRDERLRSLTAPRLMPSAKATERMPAPPP